MIKETVYSLIRQLAGTPSVLDGIRRLVPKIGESGILPGLLVNSMARRGATRSEEEMEQVVSSLEGKGLGATRVYPRSQIDFYRKITDYNRTQRYYNPRGDDPIVSVSQGPARPLRPMPTLPRSSMRGGFTVERPRIVSGFGPKTGTLPGQFGGSVPGQGGYGGGVLPGAGTSGGLPTSDVAGGEVECWLPEQRVSSSHIWSIRYNRCSKICVVTFRAGGRYTPLPKNTTPSICSGIIHQWMQKDEKPGVSYYYGGSSNPFSEDLYEQFKGAPSKGRFLWEKIRGCNSPIFPYGFFDPDIDGGIFLPVYGGEMTRASGVSGEPSPSPRG